MICTTRLVFAIQSEHLIFRQCEVEDVGVLCDAVTVGGFGEEWNLLFDAPAQQDLRGRPAEPRGDRGNGVCREEWRPCPSGL